MIEQDVALDLDHLRAVVDRCPGLRESMCWFDGWFTISLDQRRAISFRWDGSGQLDHATERRPVQGTCFEIQMTSSIWRALVYGSHSRLYEFWAGGQIKVLGNQLEFRRMLGGIAALIECIRADHQPVSQPKDSGVREDHYATILDAVVGRYTRVADLRLYYETYGTGRKVALLVHSSGLNGAMWVETACDLAVRGWSVVVPDLPGHGRSLAPSGGSIASVETFSNIIRMFADGISLFDHGPVDLVGCSLGGKIALRLATECLPYEVSSLIVVSAPDAGAGISRRVLALGRSGAGNPAAADHAEWATRSALGAGIDEATVDEYVQHSRASDPKVLNADLEAWNEDLSSHSGKVTCPTLLVRGANDYIVSQQEIVATREHIASASMVEIETAAHYPMAIGERFRDVVTSFLEQARLG